MSHRRGTACSSGVLTSSLHHPVTPSLGRSVTPSLASRLCALGITLGVLTPAHAFNIERSESRYANRQYQYELIVTLDAPLERVEAVLRDYEQYPSLDTRILQARVLERPQQNVAMLETMLRACFGPFCRNVKRVERVEESPHQLAAITDPLRSDVKFGETHTLLSTAGTGHTRVIYRTSIVPAFWIPALAGRRWMLNTLEDATSDLFMNVEMKAKEGQRE